MDTTPQPDPTLTDPDKYIAILDDEKVRVLDYRDKPGDKTNPHYHRPFVLYALSSFRRRIHFSDGTTSDREFKPGDVFSAPAQTHIGENIGDTDTHVIMVELK